VNWGDELCGIEVTPESWTHAMYGQQFQFVGAWQGGAILEFVHPSAPGAWEAVENGIAGYCRLYNSGDSLPPEFYNKLRRNYRPIFPPRGWAGKTDAELWAAVFKDRAAELLGDWGKDGGPMVCVLRVGIIRVYAAEDQGAHAVTVDDPAALILALQNAQVLAQRLRGDK